METFPPIPASILPADGRFGSGPSRVRPAQIDALKTPRLMGTSHRKSPVKNVVHSIREGLTTLFNLPDGYEVTLGNGGASAFWDVAAASLIRKQAAFATFGEFGAKFATEVDKAPHLADALRVEGQLGTVVTLTGNEAGTAGEEPDAFGYPHHETSTGTISRVNRIGGEDALTLVDATSIAGAAHVDIANTDAYYFSPQKAFASDGGLWVAVLSPAAVERAQELHGATDRWMPTFFDLSVAISNSRKDQTLNTPAVATLIMMDQQIQWMNAGGGLEAMEARSRAASDLIYAWADASSVAHPFVENKDWRSPVVVTVEFDDVVDVRVLSDGLRASGIVDIDAYRGVGRNQLRIATWPSTPTSDVEALLESIDWALERAL